MICLEGSKVKASSWFPHPLTKTLLAFNSVLASSVKHPGMPEKGQRKDLAMVQKVYHCNNQVMNYFAHLVCFSSFPMKSKEDLNNCPSIK